MIHVLGRRCLQTFSARPLFLLQAAQSCSHGLRSPRSNIKMKTRNWELPPSFSEEHPVPKALKVYALCTVWQIGRI
ncbi:hypothetical protein CPB83DRAFT_411769 [Crepidotus variabilis]|uniref:Uncharacterized protein n=1 Tax=Crepidotus variabilis TaxID=179855 RepID=A0A9P6ESH3_9AGAR|nr:hypothetical protein CPB83DRAFT_411769 [Crepidotus variabilis]